ncbi:MAG: glycosyl hydrolase, partial [Pseudomonadota bacterium]
ITGDIPERHLVWRIVQDHVNPNLLFTATEFGLFFTLDGGQKWVELTGDAPTISFRDVTIQRREDDLVAASFGRGFFVVDDISPLRELTEQSLEQEAMLFTGRDALWYIEQHPLAFSEGGAQGHGYYRAPNPPFGANFTYYLSEDVPSLEAIRQEREKPLNEANEDTPFPGFEAITDELQETDPVILLTVRDADGNVVRRIEGPAKKGFHRVNWDLRYPNTTTVFVPEGQEDEPSGFLVSPGEYTVSLARRVRGVTTELVGPQSFSVNRLRDGALPPQPDATAFWDQVATLDRSVTAAGIALMELEPKIGFLKTATSRARGGDPVTLDNSWQAIRDEANALAEMLNGNAARNALFERTLPTVRSRLNIVLLGLGGSTYGPTQTHREQLSFAEAEFDTIRSRLTTLVEMTIPRFETELLNAGAPWVPGGKIP